MGYFRNRRFNTNDTNNDIGKKINPLSNDLQKLNIFFTADENLNFLKSFFGDAIGMIVNKYEITQNNLPCCLAYIESISDIEMIRKHILSPLLNCKLNTDNNQENILNLLQTKILSATNTYTTETMCEIIESMLNGDAVIFLEHTDTALIIGSRKVEKKAVEGPENEGTVLGSQESFSDDLKINMSLVIKRLPTPSLRFEEFTVGTLSRTKVKLMWLDKIADQKTIDEVKRRINRIDKDNVDGIGVLGELIEDIPISLFPKFRQTERPDVVSKSLTDGRFAIICSNSPFSLVAPISFWDNFKTMDDYEERTLSSSYLRIVRMLAFVLSILASPLYLSFITYNQAIIPPALALHIAAGRSGVPFPSVVEVFALTIGVSIIREAGLRMPGSVGYFIGVLSAVVIGQAIVSAGYVSDSVIIIIAVSTISGFALSTSILLQPVRLINFFLLILTSLFGMFGLINGLVVLLWHISTLSSFGVPYLYPIVPFDWEGAKDTLIRLPYRVMKKRMKLLSPNNRTRVGKKGIK